MSVPSLQRCSERYSARSSARPSGADKDIDHRPQTGDHRQETGEVLGLADLLKRLPRIADAMLANDNAGDAGLLPMCRVEQIRNHRTRARRAGQG